MALADGQVQVRDLVMGPGTPYRLRNTFDPFSNTVRADQSDARAWNHGSWSGAEWLEKKVVPMTITVTGSTVTEVISRRHDLAAAFAPVGAAAADVELRFARGGVEYVLFGRPRLVDVNNQFVGAGAAFVDAVFVSLDGFIYNGTESVAGPFGLPEFTGGLAVPVRVPFTVDGVLVAGFADLVNAGKADTPLLIRIDGPVSEPRFTLRHPDGEVETLRLLLDLGVGQWVTIDTGAHTVLLQDVASRRAQVIGTFPLLKPGTSRLRFFAADFNDQAQLTATWRHTWW